MTRSRSKLHGLVACALLAGCSSVDRVGDDDGGTMEPPATQSDAGMEDDAGTGDAGGAPADASDAALDAGGDASDADANTDDAGDGGGDDSPPRLPVTLAQSGLYVDGSTSELAPGVFEFTPAYVLWTDGADKSRWLQLPEGEQIDTSDMDAWRFPVGTKAWKEFRRDGKRLETRLLLKTRIGWYPMAFIWNEEGTEAVEAPDGMANVLGTTHDVPSQEDCATCHESMTDWLLGPSAIQLSGARDGLTLDRLVDEGLLSDPPAADFALPDELAWNALGYMHANCGTCHNPAGEAYDRVDLDLWLRTGQLTAVTDTESYKTTVGVAFTEVGGPDNRIEAGLPADSAVIFRMMMRGNEESMPPLGSEIVDQQGIDLVSDWIETL